VHEYYWYPVPVPVMGELIVRVVVRGGGGAANRFFKHLGMADLIIRDTGQYILYSAKFA
jgi:hypothetical protein